MKTIFFLLLVSAPGIVTAQQPGSVTLTLQQAKEQGLKNRFDVRAQRYTPAITDMQVRQSKNAWLPDFRVNSHIQYNTQLQATMIPAGFTGLSKPELLALGAKNVSIAGLDLSQVIFQPTLATDVRIARVQGAMQAEKDRQDEIEIKTQIAQAYLDVQLKQWQLRIARDDEARYEDYYAVAEATFRAGSLLENDLLKAQLDQDNAAANTQTAARQLSLSVQNLHYQVNLPPATTIVLADSLADPGEDPASGQPFARPEIRQLQLKQQNNDLDAQRIRKSDLPELSFFANYSKQFLGGAFNYSQTEWWTPFSYLGLKISVPLTGIYKNKTILQQNRLHSQQTDLLLQQKMADIAQENQQATGKLNDARVNMINTQRNYGLSQQVYATQKKQYAFGSLPYSQLLDTEKSLSATEQNYLRAIYDYLVAKIQYDRAAGIM